MLFAQIFGLFEEEHYYVILHALLLDFRLFKKSSRLGIIIRQIHVDCIWSMFTVATDEQGNRMYIFIILHLSRKVRVTLVPPFIESSPSL